METLFINQYYSSEEVRKEAYKASQAYKINVYVLPIIFFFLAFTDLIEFFRYGYYESFYLILAIVYTGLIHFLMARGFKRATAQRNELFGENPLVYTEICNDMLRSFDPKGGKTEVYYCNIKKVKLTKNLVLIVTNSKLMFMLHREGFQPVNCEAFLSLLSSKGIKIK